MRKLLCCISICTCLAFHIANAQVGVPLINPSFEWNPVRHTFGTHIKGASIMYGWIDWNLFPLYSPPDIHGINTLFWHVETLPQEGATFVSLVTRDDETWECIGQKLKYPLQESHQYDLTLFLCQDSRFASPTKQSEDEVLFIHPTIVRIWGANVIGELKELLAESETVTHEDWREYTLYLRPRNNFAYLVIEAFYPSGSTEPANGHVLIDNAKLLKMN